MAWLPDSENFFEDMFIHFDRMNERDRRTDTAHDDMHRPRSRGKNVE